MQWYDCMVLQQKNDKKNDVYFYETRHTNVSILDKPESDFFLNIKNP